MADETSYIDIPNVMQPMVDGSGRITTPWFMLLQTMFVRTGGTAASPTATVSVVEQKVAAGIEDALTQAPAMDVHIDPVLLAYIDNRMVEMFLQSPVVAMQIEQRVSEMAFARTNEQDNLSEMIFAPGEATPNAATP